MLSTQHCHKVIWNQTGCDCSSKCTMTADWQKAAVTATGSCQTDVLCVRHWRYWRPKWLLHEKVTRASSYCWWVFWAAAAKWWRRCTSWRPWQSNPAWENSGACSARSSAMRDGKQSGAGGRRNNYQLKCLCTPCPLGGTAAPPQRLERLDNPMTKKLKRVKQRRRLHYRRHPLKQEH